LSEYPQSNNNVPGEGADAQMSPETLLETLGAQANDAAMWPGSLREDYFFAYDLLLDQSNVSRFVKGMPWAKNVYLPLHRLVWPYYHPPAGSALPSLLRTNREEDCVWGILYFATGRDLSLLARNLRTPNRYHRRGIITKDRGGRRFNAFTYVLTLQDDVMGKPSVSYKDRLIAAAEERKLPEEWLAELRAIESGPQKDIATE
jgi:hypothetical protein